MTPDEVLAECQDKTFGLERPVYNGLKDEISGPKVPLVRELVNKCFQWNTLSEPKRSVFKNLVSTPPASLYALCIDYAVAFKGFELSVSSEFEKYEKEKDFWRDRLSVTERQLRAYVTENPVDAVPFLSDDLLVNFLVVYITDYSSSWKQREKYQEYLQEIHGLRQLILQFQIRGAQFLQNYDNQNRVINDLRNEVLALKTRNLGQTRENVTLGRQNLELRRDLTQSQQETQAQTAELARTRDLLRDETQKLERLEQNFNLLEAEVQTARNANATLTDAFTQKLREAAEEQVRLKAAFEQLQARKEQIDQLAQRASDKSTQKITQLKEELARRNDEILQRREEAGKTQSQFLQELENVKKKSVTDDKTIKGLQNKVQQLEEEKKLLITEKAEQQVVSTNQNEALNKKISSLTEEKAHEQLVYLTQTQKLRDELQKQEQLFKKQIKQKDAEIKATKDTIAEQKRIIDLNKIEISRLQKAVEHTKERKRLLDLAHTNNDKLITENNKLKTQNEKLQKQLKESQSSDLIEAQPKFQQVVDDYKNLESSFKNLDERFNLLSDENTELKLNLESAADQLDSKVYSRTSDLQRELQKFREKEQKCASIEKKNEKLHDDYKKLEEEHLHLNGQFNEALEMVREVQHETERKFSPLTATEFETEIKKVEKVNNFLIQTERTEQLIKDVYNCLWEAQFIPTIKITNKLVESLNKNIENQTEFFFHISKDLVGQTSWPQDVKNLHFLDEAFYAFYAAINNLTNVRETPDYERPSSGVPLFHLGDYIDDMRRVHSATPYSPLNIPFQAAEIENEGDGIEFKIDEFYSIFPILQEEPLMSFNQLLDLDDRKKDDEGTDLFKTVTDINKFFTYKFSVLTSRDEQSKFMDLLILRASSLRRLYESFPSWTQHQNKALEEMIKQAFPEKLTSPTQYKEFKTKLTNFFLGDSFELNLEDSDFFVLLDLYKSAAENRLKDFYRILFVQQKMKLDNYFDSNDPQRKSSRASKDAFVDLTM